MKNFWKKDKTYKLGFKKSTRNNVVFFMCYFCVTSLLMYLWRMGRDMCPVSDETTVFFMGKDFLEGNFFLKDWSFTTGVFLLPGILMVVINYLFGYRSMVFYLVLMISYSLVITIPVFYIFKIIKEKARGLFFSFMLFLVIIIPRSGYFYNAGTHTLVIAVSMGIFGALYKLSSRADRAKRIIVFLLIGFISGWIAFTNTIFLYTCIMPLILTGILLLYKNANRGGSYLFYGGVSFASYEFFKWLYIYNRGPLGIEEKTFTSLADIDDSIFVGICNAMQLYGVNFYEQKAMSIETVKAVFGGVVFLIFAIEIIRCKKSYLVIDRNVDFIYMFGSMALINFLAYVMSSLAIKTHDTHLLMPFLIGYSFCGLLCMYFNMATNANTNKYMLMAGICLLIFITSFQKIELHLQERGKKAVSNRKDIAEELMKRGMVYGFSNYSLATPIMYYSGGVLKIAPIQSSESDQAIRVWAMPWLTKQEYIDHSIDYVVMYKNSYKESYRANYWIDDAKLTNAFGNNYSMDDSIGKYEIRIYNEPVSLEGIYGSGSYLSQMKISDDSMVGENGDITIKKGQVMFGPYIFLEKEGKYILKVRYDAECDFVLKITAECGQKHIRRVQVPAGKKEKEIIFSIDEVVQNVEFVVDDVAENVVVEDIFLSYEGEE